MAGKLDNVRDAALRARLDEARRHLGARQPTEAVHVVSEAFLGMLRDRPEMLTKTIQLQNGMRVPMLMRWPSLGANLVPDSVKAGEPRIDYVRERFALSEAITYYEFTVDTALAEGF
jgi:hypothetical protein